MQLRVGHENVIPPGHLKCVALHCLQGDLLSQKDVTHREIALRCKAPVRNYIARLIQFVNVHHLAAPDAIAGSGVRTHNFKLAQSVPLLRLLRAQPGTKKSKAPLFNFARSTFERRQIRKTMSSKTLNATGMYAAACAIFRVARRLWNVSQCNAGIEESYGNPVTRPNICCVRRTLKKEMQTE